MQLGAVDKTRCGRDRECDWTRSVALFVTSSPRRVLDKRFPPCAMSHPPRLEPIVLISSLPPGSPSRKRKLREEEPSGALISSPPNGQSGTQRVAQRMYVCEPRLQEPRGLIYYSNPSAQVQVLLPPLGSWKRRLLDDVGNRPHIFDQAAASSP